MADGAQRAESGSGFLDEVLHCVAAEIRGRKIAGHRVNVDASLCGEATGLRHAGLRQIDARDLKPLACQKDGIPALAFGHTQHPATRQTADVFSQELVGFGAVQVAVCAEALLPGGMRRRRVRWC